MLHIENIECLRNDGAYTFRLKIPRLDVARGEIVLVQGESGSGKSTLLNLLALALPPTDAGLFAYAFAPDETYNVGKLWEAKREAILTAIRRRYLSYILQTGGLPAFFSILQFSRFTAALSGRRSEDALIQRLAERLGIEQQLSKKPAALSGGQRQRAAILTALIRSPHLVLADEPTAALDRSRARIVIDDLVNAARLSDAAVVIVSHNPEHFAYALDRTYIIEIGEQTEGITTSELREA